MTSQRQRFITYFVTVFVVSLVLFWSTFVAPAAAFLVAGLPVYLSLTLFHGQMPSTITSLLSFATVFCFLAELTLPTLGALSSRRDNASLWVVFQFVVLAVYFVVNACLISRPH